MNTFAESSNQIGPSVDRNSDYRIQHFSPSNNEAEPLLNNAGNLRTQTAHAGENLGKNFEHGNSGADDVEMPYVGSYNTSRVESLAEQGHRDGRSSHQVNDVEMDGPGTVGSAMAGSRSREGRNSRSQVDGDSEVATDKAAPPMDDEDDADGEEASENAASKSGEVGGEEGTDEESSANTMVATQRMRPATR